jgi:hypothetical protein
LNMLNLAFVLLNASESGMPSPGCWKKQEEEEEESNGFTALANVEADCWYILILEN